MIVPRIELVVRSTHTSSGRDGRCNIVDSDHREQARIMTLSMNAIRKNTIFSDIGLKNESLSFNPAAYSDFTFLRPNLDRQTRIQHKFPLPRTNYFRIC